MKRPWSEAELRSLREMKAAGRRFRDIAHALGRSLQDCFTAWSIWCRPVRPGDHVWVHVGGGEWRRVVVAEEPAQEEGDAYRLDVRVEGADRPLYVRRPRHRFRAWERHQEAMKKGGYAVRGGPAMTEAEIRRAVEGLKELRRLLREREAQLRETQEFTLEALREANAAGVTNAEHSALLRQWEASLRAREAALREKKGAGDATPDR